MAATLTDDIFKCKFLSRKNVLISIKISLSFVPTGPIDINSSLVQVMAWRRKYDKPLHERMVAQFNGTYMRHLNELKHALRV